MNGLVAGYLGVVDADYLIFRVLGKFVVFQ